MTFQKTVIFRHACVHCIQLGVLIPETSFHISSSLPFEAGFKLLSALGSHSLQNFPYFVNCPTELNNVLWKNE
jgi:hypothetical protein